MTFEEYFSAAVAQGMNPAHRGSMLCAWDAALCEAKAACFVQGRLQPADVCGPALSALHSWVKPTPLKIDGHRPPLQDPLS
jgi:hypothetical protein